MSSSSGNDFSRNIVIFGVENSSSFHTNNRVNNFLVLGEEQNDDVNGNASTILELTLVKRKLNFAWVCLIVVIIAPYLLMEKKNL